VLGRCKVSGPIVFLHSATDDEGRADGWFYAVVVLAAHRVRGIGEVFLADTVETDAKYAGLVRVDRHLGAPDQVAERTSSPRSPTSGAPRIAAAAAPTSRCG